MREASRRVKDIYHLKYVEIIHIRINFMTISVILILHSPTDFPDALDQVILISLSQNDFSYLKIFSSQIFHTTLTSESL